MKNKLLFLGIVASLLIACESDDTADIIITDNSVTNNITNSGGNEPGSTTENLSGVYTEDLTLDPEVDYVITGPVLMASGTTLTIPAGMTIKAQPVGVNAYIAIQQGAMISAVGSASSPIVLTSNASSPASGDWGGLVICGSAPINSTADGSSDTSTSEIGGLSYGGNIPADDSGSIQYMRIEYAGGAIDGNAELNGLSLYAVGNGTTIDYVQVFEGSDDGIEFFGGTVNASHIAVVNAEDDSIDWTEGFIGALTDVYVQHGVSHDKAFECDGYNTDFSNEGGYFSAPDVTNVTIIGANDGSEAIRLRAGTQGLFTNLVITDFDEAFDLDGDTGDNPTGQGVIDGLLNVSDVTFNNVVTKLKNDTGFTFTEGDFISGDGNGTGTDVASWGAGWTVGIN
ncbi:MAG: multidrug transporter [Flavobacteriaceae bacterium]|nr:multidrug transporter [Muriicola sp.]MBT8290294.1 multidrug transporter [Muriicola sp.]NNC62031.1 multidrug transporter [Eudoraea sp.]NNK35490.1 multidrug transporter [Eudoraea sp.]NNL38714.1 multidrug transporter [Flavobacteriaceae bacterium]